MFALRVSLELFHENRQQLSFLFHLLFKFLRPELDQIFGRLGLSLFAGGGPNLFAILILEADVVIGTAFEEMHAGISFPAVETCQWESDQSTVTPRFQITVFVGDFSGCKKQKSRQIFRFSGSSVGPAGLEPATR